MKELTEEELELIVNMLLDAITFYADPSIYHAVCFTYDNPCGSFIDDFSQDMVYGRPVPGKKARETLESITQLLKALGILPAVDEETN